MKKHFLILMLMALLPLAGWAADLSKGTIVVPSVYYGQEPDETAITVANEANAPLGTTNYDFNGYFSDAACTVGVTKAQIAAANVGTTFYAKVTGKNGYENSLIGSFEVQKMALTLTGTPGSKVYGTTADGDIYTVATIVDADGTDLKTTFASKLTFSRVAGTDAAEYEILATITDANLAKNYTIESSKILDAASSTTPKAQAKYVINPKAFTAANISVDPVAAVDYTGSQIKPTVVVKDKALNTTLTADKDYTVAYGANVNVATGGTITITGKGNYTTASLSDVTFAINKATAIINSTASKSYDGSNKIPDSGDGKLTYTYQGAPAGTSVTIATGYEPTSNAPAAGTVGTYEITVDATKFTADNYTFLANKGVFTISKIELTATADDASLAYGDEENFTATITGNITADATAAENAVKVTKAAAASTDGSYVLTPEFKTEAEIEATVDITATRKAEIDALTGKTDAEKAAMKASEKTAAQAAAKAVLKNYTLKAVAGKVTYTDATLKIALNESKYTLKKVYDGKDATVATPTSEDQLTIIGRKNASDVIDLSGLTVTITPIGGSIKNANTYQVVLAGATAENYTITYIPSLYEITPKDLTVVASDQTFVAGTKLKLNTTAYTVDGLVEGDKAEEVFKLAWKEGSGLADDAVATTTLTANDVIDIVSAGTTSKWGNYKLTTASELGDLTVAASEAITLDDTKDLTTVLTADKTGATVTFSARAINAEQWNVLVLPFDVTVKALSQALGYAVVDVFDTNASDGNIHFKLKVAGTISANTPMLVYPNGEINNLNSIVITSVNVKKVTDNVSVADASGNKFVGTYKTTPIFGEKFRYFSKGMWYDAAKYTEASPAPIQPLRAYLDLTGNAAAARALIYIDEPDGTTTAINAISGEVISKNAEGWYTIGGMKLEGAPTQKGIYINNGKKVVVK